MANLKLVKDIAAIKGMTLDQLAAKAEISTQAIHLMARSGKTKIETLEKIAEILDVPSYVFLDDNFDVQMFRDYVVQGNHNPTSFFGPVYNGSETSLTEKEDGAPAKSSGDKPIFDYDGLMRTKDDMINLLQTQVADLRADKDEMRAVVQSLRAEIEDLKKQLKQKNK